MLYAKFGGLCAFCGHELGNRWHIWDIEPRNTIVTIKGAIILGNDSYENKLPACTSCNTTRGHYSDCHHKINIEQFRAALYSEFEFLRKAQHSCYAYYKKAIKFGLLEETGKEIIFYFEKFS